MGSLLGMDSFQATVAKAVEFSIIKRKTGEIGVISHAGGNFLLRPDQPDQELVGSEMVEVLMLPAIGMLQLLVVRSLSPDTSQDEMEKTNGL